MLLPFLERQQLYLIIKRGCMNRILLTSLAMWAVNFFKGLNLDVSPSVKISRLKMAILYVQGIKTMRLLFMSLLALGACLVFLLVGLIIFNVTIFMYTSFDVQTKMYLGFSFTAVFLLIAAGFFALMFQEERWASMFHTKAMIKELVGENKDA